jgi:hypothetical protein
MASPMQGLLTDILALGTGRLVGRTIELSRPEGAVAARIERVAVVPSDPTSARVLDPVAWWLDTVDAATTGMARLLEPGDANDEAAGRVDLLESVDATLRDVTTSGRRIDRIELRTVNVDAVLGLRPLVRCGPISLIATLTVDDVRTWLPPSAADLGRSLRLGADGCVSIGWKRGRLVGEVTGRVETHAETVDVVAERLQIAGRRITIPRRWRQRRSLSTASLTAIGAQVRDVTVHERAVTVALAFAGWTEPVTYEQLATLQFNLVERAGRLAVELVRGRPR